jgi:hypothetical protein
MTPNCKRPAIASQRNRNFRDDVDSSPNGRIALHTLRRAPALMPRRRSTEDADGASLRYPLSRRKKR